MKFFLIFLLCILVGQTNLQGQNSASYTASIKHFDSLRVKALTEQNGWLNLAGLYWLKPGDNTFGSAVNNTLVFKHKNMPASLGKFKVVGSRVSFEFNKAVTNFPSDYSEEMVLFDLSNKTDTSIYFKQFVWSVIIREDKIGVRFRDLKNPALIAFKGNKRFAIHEKWNLPAKLLPPNPSGLFITNVLGQTTAQDYAGKISFEYQGKNYVLDAINEGPGDLFVVFGDATNGINTYHTGRFMYVSRPDSNGNTFIDFNKSFNPPCAYTPFATCPIPPRQNILPFKVTAGELSDKHK
ncbi:MAG: DUF1684 domain-containing protein [Bacteroidota bacterium]|jgi:uncharacterized protein (DUF1684 family)